MKFNIFKIFALSALVVCISTPVKAVTEAGEIQRKETKQPKGNLYVSNNIADMSIGTSSTDEIEERIDFSADEMINDEKNSTITAKGNVEINYNGMRLTADKLIYNQENDTIVAKGKTTLYTADGGIIRSTYVNLADNMSVGDMYNIKALLKDKSTVTAERFRRKNNKTKVLNYATYTACDICEGKFPLWHVSARKVQHNENTQNVNYNDAFVYIKGVPVFYTPFLTHPAPEVKRRSGFLQPTIGSSSFLGAYFQPRYFWAVNNQTNVMLSPILSAEKDLILSGSYSHYFYNAYTSISGSYLKNDNDTNWPKNRGNIFAKGRYDINNYWRMKYDWKYVSDYIYLKELNLPYNDNAWLDSSVAFERFSGRDYVSVEAYYYKMLSYNLRRRNARQYRAINNRKPFVAPLIDAEFYSDPSAIGSYFKNHFDSASIYHRNGTNTQRLTSINSWELPYTSRFGEKYRFVASLKSDAYYVNRYNYANNNTYTGTTSRFFPQAGVEWRLPFVRATKHTRQIAEPVVVAVAAPNGGNKEDKIPNEDSEDVYFDDTNVLDLDRYAGYDRNDTGSRVSYGLRWSSYGDIFGRTSAFIAQSYEQKRDSNFMTAIDNKKQDHASDFVGRINAEPNRYLDLNYRFRLDKENLDAKYSELSATVGPSFLRFNASYIFLQGNTHYIDRYSERKELYTSVKANLTQFWSLKIYNLQDLTEKSKGSLEHGGSVVYEDECFKVDTTVKRYNSSNPDLDNDYEFGVTFFLKTIGSVGS